MDVLADVLDAEAERNQPGHEPFMNPAKSLALRLADHTPLLWGTDPLAAAVAGPRRPRRSPRHAGVVAHAAEVGRAAGATGAGARTGPRRPPARDIFRDPFDDDPDGPATPPAAAGAAGHRARRPGQVTLRRTGRGWPAADVLHPVDEVPRGARHAALLRAALLASRLDVAAVYLGLATRTIEPAGQETLTEDSWSCWTTPCARTRGDRAP